MKYYELYEKTITPKIFNFFNTLIPEDEKINDIIDIQNIINYL